MQKTTTDNYFTTLTEFYIGEPASEHGYFSNRLPLPTYPLSVVVCLYYCLITFLIRMFLSNIA